MGEVVQLVLAAPQSLLLPQKVALALVGIRVLRYAGRRAGRAGQLSALLPRQHDHKSRSKACTYDWIGNEEETILGEITFKAVSEGRSLLRMFVLF